MLPSDLEAHLDKNFTPARFALAASCRRPRARYYFPGLLRLGRGVPAVPEEISPLIEPDGGLKPVSTALCQKSRVHQELGLRLK